MRKYIVLSLVLGSLSAMAALPGYAESTRRIKALLENPEVQSAVGNFNWVVSVQQKSASSELYEVRSKKCAADVRVSCQPTTIVGPCPFDIKVVGQHCLSDDPGADQE